MATAFAAQSGFAGKKAFALIAAAALLEGTGIMLLVPIIAVIVAPGNEGHSGRLAGVFRAAGLASPVSQLGLLIAAFLVVALVRAITVYRRDRTLAELQAAFVESRRNEILEVLAAAPWSRIVRISAARVNSLLSLEINRVALSLQLLVRTGVTLLMMAAQIGVAFWLSPGLTTCILLLLTAGAVVGGFAQERIRRLGDRHVIANRAMMASSSSLLAGLKTAVAQNAQGYFLGEYRAIQADARQSVTRFETVQARTRLAFAVGSALFAAVLVFGGFAAFDLSPSRLMTVVLICARLSGAAMLLFTSTQQLVFVLPSFGIMAAFTAELRAPVPAPRREAAPALDGAIALHAVRYRHPGGGGIEEATLTIPPGSFVGLTGPSGAGKTTLVDLIAGLIEPESGAVRVGGKTLDGQTRPGWAATLAYVSQDGFLFNDTIRRNLGWSAPGANDAALWDALELVGARALVSRLPAGLDTIVGERGALLSGGERQRLALARALLCRPRLLVLDEAMNAIDAPGEAELLDRLTALRPRPTILMISHREASLDWCDRLLHVDNGHVRSHLRQTS